MNRICRLGSQATELKQSHKYREKVGKKTFMERFFKRGARTFSCGAESAGGN